jgi:hypothetical protein
MPNAALVAPYLGKDLEVELSDPLSATASSKDYCSELGEKQEPGLAA